MSGVISLTFAGSKVGLVVRGKSGPTDDPGLMAQHADCILPDGAPVGFFGDAAPASGGGASAYWNEIGMNMKGHVYDYPTFVRLRPFYVDALAAARAGLFSTVLVVQATAGECALFAEYWRKLKADPGKFNLLGNNCSTHASAAFIYAGIVSDGIPGLDTPNNLYNQLSGLSSRATATYSGFVGFLPTMAGGFNVVVDAPSVRQPVRRA